MRWDYIGTSSEPSRRRSYGTGIPFSPGFVPATLHQKAVAADPRVSIQWTSCNSSFRSKPHSASLAWYGVINSWIAAVWLQAAKEISSPAEVAAHLYQAACEKLLYFGAETSKPRFIKLATGLRFDPNTSSRLNEARLR